MVSCQLLAAISQLLIPSYQLQATKKPFPPQPERILIVFLDCKLVYLLHVCFNRNMLASYLPKKYYVYIVKCSDGTFYTGKTNDLPRRLLQHNGELINGAKYTRSRRPVELIFYEEYLTNRLACMRELEIKKMNRKEKLDLIYCHNQTINNRWLTR